MTEMPEMVAGALGVAHGIPLPRSRRV